VITICGELPVSSDTGAARVAESAVEAERRGVDRRETMTRIFVGKPPDRHASSDVEFMVDAR
jgi:hypothetical protein